MDVSQPGVGVRPTDSVESANSGTALLRSHSPDHQHGGTAAAGAGAAESGESSGAVLAGGLLQALEDGSDSEHDMLSPGLHNALPSSGSGKPVSPRGWGVDMHSDSDDPDAQAHSHPLPPLGSPPLGGLPRPAAAAEAAGSFDLSVDGEGNDGPVSPPTDAPVPSPATTASHGARRSSRGARYAAKSDGVATGSGVGIAMRTLFPVGDDRHARGRVSSGDFDNPIMGTGGFDSGDDSGDDASGGYFVGRARGKRARRARQRHRQLRHESTHEDQIKAARLRTRFMWAGLVFLGLIIGLIVLMQVLSGDDACTGTQCGTTPPALLNVNMTAHQLRQYCSARLGEVQSLRDEAVAIGGVPRLLQLGNDMDVRIATVSNLGYLMQNTHPDPQVRQAGTDCFEAASANATALGLDTSLYAAYRALDDAGTVTSPPDSVRYLNKTMTQFLRSGVGLSGFLRDKLQTWDSEITSLGSTFETNINQDTRSLRIPANDSELLAGLPSEFVASHTTANGEEVVVTTDYPDYFPVMVYAESAVVRKNLSSLFHNRGYPANLPVLNSLLEKRAAYAQLVGYNTWAAFSQATKMARDPSTVQSFLDHVVSLARPISDSDVASLLTFKRQTEPAAAAIEVSDAAFYSNIARQSLYNVDAKEVRSYFTYDRTRNGLLRVCSRLFHLRFVDVSDEVVKWHPDVEVFDVFKSSSAPPSVTVAGMPQGYVGRMFLDMHPRPDKYKHAASFPITNGVAFGPSAQVTEVALVCNFPKTGPMEHSQVVTFFHETGHLIHNLVGGLDQTYAVFSGVATEWDFVEAPSQMFEEWAWDTATLQNFAVDASGKVIPSQLVADMRRAEKYGQGMRTMQQAFYATLSLKLYTAGDPLHLDTTAMMVSLQEQLSPYPYENGTHFQCSFGHLVGYSSDYYTYLWSLVIAKDMFSRFKSQGLYSTTVASAYTQKVLAPGGQQNAEVLVDDFLGRPYGMASFDAWLTSDPNDDA